MNQRPGNRTLFVSTGGLAPHREVLKLERGQTREVVVVLRPGAVLHGTVHTPAGKPVAAATIESDYRDYPQPGEVKTDANGHFRFHNLSPGDRTFEVMAPGMTPVRQTFALESGGEQEWNAVLSDSQMIRGRLIDSDGAALANWWLGMRTARRRAKSDEEGRFTIAADARADTLLVRGGPGFAPIVARFEDVAPDSTEQTFTIGPEHAATARFHGLLVDGGGAPLAGIAIDIEQEGWPVVLGAGPGKSQADGSFGAGPLPPGRYRVTPTPGRWVFAPVVIELERDATVDLGTLRGAVPAKLGITLTGDPALVARASVYLMAQHHRRGARGTGSSRTFDRVFPQQYELVVKIKEREYHRVAISLAPGDDQTRILDLN